ncbi:hybrid sensor histidine kinase/response regulator [Leptolyngbya ohadii]|uniref:hybrid sensor histidine kinase/response regulator n=1 Tax=Leptolyngbya ohadii TaxID=1962290 RepID=UPI000B59C857|nr:response regulator [Leptolyngbya ohadii]
MTTDSDIREKTYQYFLQEAPELLQALEQGLLSFKAEQGINQVNNLMRVTHTLKGAATSVGLKTIATVAHSLEDIFRALCNPQASIDSETEALLFEGVECLRLPLVAELSGGVVNHPEILDRAATIFTQLQEKLGDCFAQTASLPTSAELGFDVTLSIFEVGVAQRLNQIAAALAQDQPVELAATLRTQAEVFLGLAESLNLQGFGAIAQATLRALDQQPEQITPEQITTIANLALADFRTGQTAVLAGDRSQGGFPSEDLQQLAGQNLSVALTLSPRIESAIESAIEEAEFGLEQTELSEQIIAQNSDQPQESFNDALIENIWGQSTALANFNSEEEIEQSAAIAVVSAAQSDPNSPYPLDTSPIDANTTATPTPKETSNPPIHVRVNVKHLNELTYLAGELLTNHSRQSLQIEQIQNTTQALVNRIRQHQQHLNQLRSLSAGKSNVLERKPRKSKKRLSRNESNPKATGTKNEAQPLSGLNSSNTKLIQSLLDDIVQLTEVADAIDLFARESSQTVENQRSLLTNTRRALIEARMLPLGEILNRLPPIVQQLETLHSKQVKLELNGAEVLVDKVVAEKLYNPLLHLVRNAFDHGIEPPAIRQQQDKVSYGTIGISARNQGKYLLIEVQDDGKGLDFEQILRRAIEGQIIPASAAANLKPSELIDLLFEPGFSTADRVSDLSGRGIGLDVVRDQIQALGGSVTVESRTGEGTQFTLKIPLNLTVAPLLVFEAQAECYALLDDAIEQIIIPQSNQVLVRNNRRILQWGKGDDIQLVPLYRPTDLLSFDTLPHLPQTKNRALATQADIKPVILIRVDEALFGLEADQLIGEQELVIRPFSSLLKAPDYIHGASILPNRRLALVIDGALLMQEAADRLVADSLVADSLLQDDRPVERQNFQNAPLAVLPGLPNSAIASNSHTSILVVEDSITTRQALVMMLQKSGYQVHQAHNGYEALAQLQQQKIELVLCDLEMPNMNGFEFLRRVQQSINLADLPILMLTSRNDPSYRLLASQLGAAAYMTKPYMEHKLLEMVATLLQKSALR